MVECWTTTYEHHELKHQQESSWLYNNDIIIKTDWSWSSRFLHESDRLSEHNISKTSDTVFPPYKDVLWSVDYGVSMWVFYDSTRGHAVAITEDRVIMEGKFHAQHRDPDRRRQSILITMNSFGIQI